MDVEGIAQRPRDIVKADQGQGQGHRCPNHALEESAARNDGDHRDAQDRQHEKFWRPEQANDFPGHHDRHEETDRANQSPKK